MNALPTIRISRAIVYFMLFFVLVNGVIFSFVRDHVQNSAKYRWATTALVARRCPFPLNRKHAPKAPLGQAIHVGIS